MTFNLLASAANIVFICVIVALLVAFFVWSFISNKKKQKNFNDTINAVKPGSKVKTIGGVCAEVVEIDDEEDTFVLKTGTSDGSGVSYLKFDKQAIYQTDAKPEPKAEEPVKEEKSAKEEKAEEPFEEGKTEEKPAEAPAEEKDEKKE